MKPADKGTSEQCASNEAKEVAPETILKRKNTRGSKKARKDSTDKKQSSESTESEKKSRDGVGVSFDPKTVAESTSQAKDDEDPEPVMAEMFEDIFSRRASFKVKTEVAEKELHQRQMHLKVLNELTHKTELTDEDKKRLEFIDDNRQAFMEMDPRKKSGVDSPGSDPMTWDDIFSRRGSFKIKAVECEKAIKRNIENAAAGKSDLAKELRTAMMAMKNSELDAAKKGVLESGSNCPGCGLALSPEAKQAAVVVDVFKKVDDYIRGLRKQVNALRTFDGKTLEEVCPGLNDALDQFIKEIMNLKDANKKITKAAQAAVGGPPEVVGMKAGAKPKPGSRDFSFSLTSLTESTMEKGTASQDLTDVDKNRPRESQDPPANTTAPGVRSEQPVQQTQTDGPRAPTDGRKSTGPETKVPRFPEPKPSPKATSKMLSLATKKTGGTAAPKKSVGIEIAKTEAAKPAKGTTAPVKAGDADKKQGKSKQDSQKIEMPKIDRTCLKTTTPKTMNPRSGTGLVTKQGVVRPSGSDVDAPRPESATESSDT